MDKRSVNKKARDHQRHEHCTTCGKKNAHRFDAEGAKERLSSNERVILLNIVTATLSLIQSLIE